ncbi:MAG TPA: SDR family NAD(P)-dependent oxidoreductase [Urbifossiella sp.]|nr:SDR family NAD(P)-dependent oxidoreductase [Urbifossiella sp.]
MSVKLKKLADQVIVITGASSGIGLATVEAAAKKGAKVVLAARSDETLDEVVGRISAAGGTAVAVPCDVTDRAQVDRLAAEAVRAFGRIDTHQHGRVHPGAVAGGDRRVRRGRVGRADSHRLADGAVPGGRAEQAVPAQ